MTVEPIRDMKKIEAMKKILLADRTFGKRNHLLFVFGINSGLRISDILSMTIADVATAKGKVRKQVTIKEKKTGKNKTFVLNKNITAVLQEYLDEMPELVPNIPLFKSRKLDKTGKYKALSRIQAWEILTKAAKMAGIENMGTHTMRKTFGYHAYRAGYGIEKLQEVFNHSSPAITKRYIGITQDEINEIYINVNL